MSRLAQDLKFAARDLAKNRGFTFAAVLALALGIGASTAIFSILDALWLRPYQFASGERLQMLWESEPKNGLDRSETSVMAVDDARQSGVFSELAGFDNTDINLGGEGAPERVPGARVQAAFFDALEVKPRLGRAFVAGEDTESAQPVVVLSDRLWNARFGGDPAILGKAITLDGRSHTVIGITPPGFGFPTGTDLWIPLLPNEVERTTRGQKWLRTVGRLAPGVTLDQAKEKLAALSERLRKEDAPHWAGRAFVLTTVRDAYVGPVRPVLLALAGAVGLLLLIACANVANLLLARATVRARELAVRAALGASRRQLVAQLLTESVALAVAGAAVGILFALWCTDLLTALAPGLAERLARGAEIRLDHRVLTFTLVASVITALVFGLVPALHASKPDLHSTLKEGGRGIGGRGRLRNGLVVAEIALALVLLIGSGLLLRSLYELQASPPGFKVDGAMTFRIQLAGETYPDEGTRLRFTETFLERLRSLPGVEAAVATTILPVSNSNQSSSFTIVGRPEPAPGDEPLANMRVVSPGYFEAMGIPLVQGRDVTAQDRKDRPLVTVVNEAFVRKFFPDGDPVGQRILVWSDEPTEIVGVVGDVRNMRRGKLTETAPEAYMPLAQYPRPAMSWVLRGEQGYDLMPAVRRELSTLDSQQPLFAVRTMEQHVAESLGPQRISAGLLSLFAGIALLLAGVGVYAVMAYSVDQQRREIGVRMALGATNSGIIRWVLAHGARLTALGVGIGLLLAFGVSRLLSSQLYGVSAADPLTYSSLAALLAAIALLATWLPARRALAVDPAVTLRAE